MEGYRRLTLRRRLRIAERIEEVAGPNDLVVRAGTRHYFVNTGPWPLRLITTYAPPHHPPGTVHQAKADADAAERGT